jgi:hypothetical protein
MYGAIAASAGNVTVGHAGFVPAVTRCLLAQIAITPVLLVLTATLPKGAREPAAVTEVSEAAAELPELVLAEPVGV